MRNWVLGIAFVFAPALALASPGGGRDTGEHGKAASKSTADRGGRPDALLTILPQSTLIGKSEVDEVRAFPEMRKDSKMIENVIRISAVDRSYSVDKSYNDTVAFFDQQFKGKGFEVIARTVTQTATAWMVRRPDGNIANVAVRNTSPTTYEIVEAADTESVYRLGNVNSGGQGSSHP